MQVKRNVRKGNKTFFVMVRSLDREGPEPDADSDAGPPPPPNPVCPKTTEYQVDPQRLKELLDEYPDVFQTVFQDYLQTGEQRSPFLCRKAHNP